MCDYIDQVTAAREAAQAMYAQRFGEEQLIKMLACEPQPYHFQAADGSVDWEDYDYYHTQWARELDDIETV